MHNMEHSGMLMMWLSDADISRALRRCWTRTRTPSQPGSSRRTTSRWPWWRGWRSSGCGLRPAAGWCLSPSSWSARWSSNGPTTDRRSPRRWCPARCARLGRGSGGRSRGAGHSRTLRSGCWGPLLWRCILHWRRERSSSPGRPGGTCRWSWCLADTLRETNGPGV